MTQRKDSSYPGTKRVYPVKPVAKITPGYLKVEQGGSAVFESQSTPEGISEYWTGPGGQRGKGRQYEVCTDQLNPGRYDIVLEVTDTRRQADKASATIEVLPIPSTPETVYKVFFGSR